LGLADEEDEEDEGVGREGTRTCTLTSHSILLGTPGIEVRDNQPYRAARTLPLLAWPSASYFLERVT